MQLQVNLSKNADLEAIQASLQQVHQDLAALTAAIGQGFASLNSMLGQVVVATNVVAGDVTAVHQDLQLLHQDSQQLILVLREALQVPGVAAKIAVNFEEGKKE